MASSAARISLRLAAVLILLLAASYVGRPLYWKLSATVHDIREKRQSVKEGISQLVLEAQKSVGWVHDESDSGASDDTKGFAATSRRILRAWEFTREENLIQWTCFFLDVRFSYSTFPSFDVDSFLPLALVPASLLCALYMHEFGADDD
ncbi:hypothetical protein Cni_G24562 [Canna indica]|uniref:Uncharacterized protein n=1 Tax=Canna indica TaxID=4628 RepID=A0AAQ3QNK5_9LILI|nr:hypothetical protein Cni_G24562 [Canna indica]